MNQSLSDAGRLSAKLRQTPELLAAKSEAIRLYCDRKFGLIDVSFLINRNRGEVRRWLIAAGVYASSRSNRSKTSPERRELETGHWRDSRKIKTQVFEFVHQRTAWMDEWAGADRWDDNYHWRNHKERWLLYQSKYTKAKRRLNPAFGRYETIDFKQSVAWRTEWRGAVQFDDCAHWHRHPAKKRYLFSKAKRNMYKNNIHYKVSHSFRRRVREALIAQRAGKFRSSSEMLGCTWQFLVAYLESKFKPGMTWENYGPYWHIDHKIPCAAFDLTKAEDQKKCFHWTNLQPLTAVENFLKRDRVIPAIAA